MPRTFSLARLLFGITVFCLICGFVTVFPDYARIAVIFIPTGIVCLTLICFARRRLRMLTLSIAGAFCGIWLALGMIRMGPGRWTEWGDVTAVPMTIAPALVAFFWGLLALMHERNHPRREP